MRPRQAGAPSPPPGLWEGYFPLQLRHLKWYAGILALVFAALAVAVPALRVRALVQLALIESMAGIVWWLLLRGHTGAASVLAVSTSWVMAAAAALLTGGVTAISFTGFTVVIVLAGLLVGTGGAVIAAGLTLLLGALAPGGGGGILGTAPVLVPAAPSLLRVGMIFTFIIVFLRTAQREMADANRRTAASLSLVQATLDSTADGILVVDREGTVAGFNQKFLDLWRIPRDLADAGDDDRLITFVLDQLTDPEAFRAKVSQLYHEPEAVSFDVLEFVDGRIMERYSQPQRIEGRTIGRVWSFRDITDSRRGEAARLGLEKELFQAQKLEALGRLAGGIAHDFNNILTAIVSYTEVAKLDSEDRPAVLENLDAVVQASLRARDLVTQILVFSRARADERAPLRLGPTIGETIRLVRPTLHRGVQLIFERPAEEFSVLANPTQIHQVVMNLCVNAAQAIGEGEGRVLVRLEPFEAGDGPMPGGAGPPPGRYMLLEVSDSGHGMDPATQARIFEPFFSTKAPGKGTGLGLSVVHGIVQDHGGIIVVSSQPGTGTAFRLFFPQYAASAG